MKITRNKKRTPQRLNVWTRKELDEANKRALELDKALNWTRDWTKDLAKND